MYAVFNKKKQFLSFSENQFGENFLYKKIPEDKCDLIHWEWVGDFDSGKMEKRKIQKIKSNQDTFQNHYSYNDFMSIILKQLYITSKKSKTLNAGFEQMIKEYICSYEKPEIYLELLRYTNKL